MAQEPSWDDIFRPSGTPTPGSNPNGAPVPPTTPAAPAQPSEPWAPTPARPDAASPAARPETASPAAAADDAGVPRSRRAARESARQGHGSHGGGGDRGPRRRRNLWWLWTLIALLAVGIGGAATVWVLYEDKVREVLGWELPNDYEGTGNGVEVDVTITSGQIGSDIAQTLVDEGVTMTYEAFYDLLVAEEIEQGAPVSFVPGTYRLEEQMSASSVLAALQDPENRIVNSVAVREGVTISTIVELLSAGTGIAVADFEAAIDEGPAAYGLPDEAPNLEGYLFPATYQFDPGANAHDIVQTMVDRMFQSLDAAGVPAEERHEIVTIASLIQREARLADDFYKVSRVIQNRLELDMRLEFDSTSHYGAGSTGSVWSSPEERADVNDYNTYVIFGLPIGPISAPGDLAIDAAMNPVEGPWLFFVTVDLNTGETEFNETAAGHQASAEKLYAWCRLPENAEVCE